VPKLPGIPHVHAVRALEKAGFKVVREGKHIVDPFSPFSTRVYRRNHSSLGAGDLRSVEAPPDGWLSKTHRDKSETAVPGRGNRRSRKNSMTKIAKVVRACRSWISGGGDHVTRWSAPAR
jgi:hypothetical protein